MKKKISILCMGALLLAGCGTPKLKNGEEAVVSLKDDKKISVNDLYENVKNDFALQSLMTMVDTYILETEFKDYIDTAKTLAKNSIESAKESYGSEEQLLQFVQQYYGYSTIEGFQNYLYLNNMQSHARDEYAKVLVKDKDIEKYYKEKAKGDVEISHILITADVKDDATDDEKKAAEKTAKEKAESLIKELKKAEDVEATFKKLVKENSKDDATKDKDGSLGKITYGDLADTYDELLDAAYKIKDGEVYSKVITTELGYHVIMKTKSYEKESLDKLKDEIRDILAEDLKANTKTINLDAIEYYRDKYKFKIEDSELNKQFDSYIKRLYASYNTDDSTTTEE